MSHYCSGFRLWLWPLWLSLGPSLGNIPSEISTEALARDRMWCRCLWRCCLPLAVLLPLRRACRSPSNAAVSNTSTAASLPSPFAAELVGLGRALAFARAWFFDIAERQCFAPRDGIRLHAARHVARRASLPAPRPRSGSPLAASAPSCLVSNLTLLSCSSWWCSPLRFR